MSSRRILRLIRYSLPAYSTVDIITWTVLATILTLTYEDPFSRPIEIGDVKETPTLVITLIITTVLSYNKFLKLYVFKNLYERLCLRNLIFLSRFFEIGTNMLL